jgi:hypothetical protein
MKIEARKGRKPVRDGPDQAGKFARAAPVFSGAGEAGLKQEDHRLPAPLEEALSPGKKNPAEAGLFPQEGNRLAVENYQLDAAILCTSCICVITGYRAGLAITHGGQAGGLNALGCQVVFDRCCTAV